MISCCVFCHRGCLHLNKVDSSNPVDQLSSLTLRLLLLRGMWKKKFFLSLLRKTVISFSGELYLKCWPEINRVRRAFPHLCRNLFYYLGVQNVLDSIKLTNDLLCQYANLC